MFLHKSLDWMHLEVSPVHCSSFPMSIYSLIWLQTVTLEKFRHEFFLDISPGFPSRICLKKLMLKTININRRTENSIWYLLYNGDAPHIICEFIHEITKLLSKVGGKKCSDIAKRTFKGLRIENLFFQDFCEFFFFFWKNT